MTTTITTIREPKTFKQIQDQQNELGKQSALESLNDNISKLIKAINDKDAKRETEQDRQLKTNQLELSKLQLRRAQLGLAKDEKYYQDYSKKWNENHNIGTKLGFDHSTSTSLGATGLSLLTGGLINPVILKEVIFPIVTPLKNITKALASFPGLIPMLFNRVGGKSSSAIKSDKDRILHGKLDQILGAIKDKGKSSKIKEEKEQSLLSKLLNALLLGAVGLTALNTFVGGNMGIIGSTFEEHGKAMLAGFVFGGWRGALIGLALDLFAKETGIIPKKTDKPTLLDITAQNATSIINNNLELDLKPAELKGIVAGYYLGGWRGALLGFALTNQTFKDAVNDLRTGNFTDILGKAQRSVKTWVEGTPLESLPEEVIMGGIAGGAIGSTMGGFKGFVIGSLLGAAGGFVWDRYQNYAVAKEHGFNTRFDFETFDFKLGKSDYTYKDFYEKFLYAKDEDGNYIYTPEAAKQEAIATIKQYIEDGIIDNSETSFTSGLFDGVAKLVKEHPIEIAGITALTTGITLLSGLIDGTGVAKVLKNAGLIGVIVGLTTIANDLWKTLKGEDEVSKYIEEHPDLKKLPVSEQISIASGQIDGKRLREGFKKLKEGDMAGLWDIAVGTWNAMKNGSGEGAAQTYEFFHVAKPELLEIKRNSLLYRKKFYEDGQKKIFGREPFEEYKEAVLDYFGNLTNHPELLVVQDRPGFLNGNKIQIDETLLPFLTKYGFDPHRIQQYNDIENKDPNKRTKADVLLQEELLKEFEKKFEQVQIVDDGVWIMNLQKQEQIDKEEKKSKEEEYQCIRDQTGATQALTDVARKYLQRAKDAEDGFYSDLQTRVPFQSVVFQTTDSGLTINN